VLLDAICRAGKLRVVIRQTAQESLQPHSSKHVTLAHSRIVSSSQSSRVAPRDRPFVDLGGKQDDVSGYSAGGLQHRGPISVSVLERVNLERNGVSEEKRRNMGKHEHDMKIDASLACISTSAYLNLKRLPRRKHATPVSYRLDLLPKTLRFCNIIVAAPCQ
jgi:hypothetical protein